LYDEVTDHSTYVHVQQKSHVTAVTLSEVTMTKTWGYHCPPGYW